MRPDSLQARWLCQTIVWHIVYFSEFCSSVSLASLRHRLCMCLSSTLCSTRVCLPRRTTQGLLFIYFNSWWWLLGFYDSTRDKDDTTVGVGHSRRYCNTGYDQSQGRRPSTLKCIGPISKGDIEPNHPSEINPNSDSRSRSDGRSRRFVQYRVDQSQGQRPRSLLSFSQLATRARMTTTE